MEAHTRSTSPFRHILSSVDPRWSARPIEEQDEVVNWYDRTARAISRRFAMSFRDPCHDASDVMQEICLKLWTKFLPADAPHRLLTERPCIRNLMEWKGLDQVDWENAKRRSAKRNVPLPDDEIGLADRSSVRPDRYAEVADSEGAFRRAIRDPDERRIYLLLRTGRSPRAIAKLTGRPVREIHALRSDLRERLEAHLR